MKHLHLFSGFRSQDRAEENSDNGKQEVEELHISLTPDKELSEKLSDHIGKSKERWNRIFEKITKIKETVINLLKTIEEKLTSLSEEHDLMEKKVDKLINLVEVLREENVSPELYQNLHAELTDLQEEAKFKENKPAIKRLIGLHDSLEQAEGDDSKAWKKIVLDALRDLKVNKIEERPEKFDPDFQKAIDTEKTSSKEKDSQVLEVTHEGFKYLGDRVVRPQQVIIYKFQKNQEVDANERSNSRN